MQDGRSNSKAHHRGSALDAPSAIDTSKFTTDETDWVDSTMQTLVLAMSVEKREGYGITSVHLDISELGAFNFWKISHN